VPHQELALIVAEMMDHRDLTDSIDKLTNNIQLLSGGKRRVRSSNLMGEVSVQVYLPHDEASPLSAQR
jgi:hypothetical protein